MRVIISSLVGASLLAAFAAVGSGLISGVYEQTKEPIAAAERAAEAKQLLEIFLANRTTTSSSMTALLSTQKTHSSL